MALNSGPSVCPICEESYFTAEPLQSFPGWRFQCERCGKFRIYDEFVMGKNQPWSKVRHLVSAWIRRENKAGIVPIVGQGATSDQQLFSPEWWSDQFAHMGFPETTIAKLDALLKAYAESIKGDYLGQITPSQPYLVAEIAAGNMSELNGLTNLLQQLDYIDQNLVITAKGWIHLDEIRKSEVLSDSVFVAMWFDDVTINYRKAVIFAIESCGFEPIVIDRQDYNDFIMNQVISQIRQSRFIVADFTCRSEIEKENKILNGVRAGVYWEAGMAYGLGRPVIHTCEDNVDSRNRLHFDVRQYNTIFWKEDNLGIKIRSLDQRIENPNFVEQLAIRIRNTIGLGRSYRKEQGK